ncbi:helix-turn-helix transcriptional regulator [Actinoplanes nipponensis]|uniref:Helix-turn-helix transcriptional regulator n=1 Tax=Actinoplanes nipponensis TaxID=135950 RepID=A0A919JKZ0_9ACTN|nr:helix-turn-helix transcriptional regulator [Actinoplanes nipponensis]GIE51150.1 helix-turn-helix transcriptional regulator [Actinoplanes nipponensis]
MTVLFGAGGPGPRHDMLEGVTAHASSEVLVGREADLAALRDALKRTRTAEPSTVLVGGEAGVGKTRLIEEFSRAATAEGARVLAGQCLELGEEGLPFAPFAAALRRLVHTDGPAVLDGREPDFARLLPELGPPPPDAVGETRRGFLFELVAGLFDRLAAQQPLVLVIEDLHWADRSTRDLIGFLVRAARLPHVLLLATYRTDEMHRGHPLRPFLAELDRVRGVQRLDLDRLDRDGTAEMLTHLLGAEPEPRTVDAIHERVQGNPFFIEQFAASADLCCGDIPHSLRDLLLSRVDQLTDAAQRVLRVAAVGGTTFGHELLSRVAGVEEAELESALRAAVAAQLIVFDADGGYEFRHALVREAVHDDLLPGEHARLHARYAEAVEAEPALVAMGRAPAEIAHHWYAAHDHPRALVAAHRAAQAAGRRYAYAEQARLLERVLELWELVPEAAQLLGAGHLDLLEQTALVAIDAGDHQRALKLTRAALADLDAEAEPLRAARLLVRRSKLLYNAGTSDGAAEAREAYRLLAGAPRTPEGVALLADVAYALGGVDDEEAGRVAAEAIAAAGAVGDVSAQVSATITYGQVCGGRLSARQALPAMAAAAARARETGDLPNLARALVNVSDTLFELGRYEESAAAAAEGVPYADRVGVSRTTGVFLLANHAEALIALGHWDEADARCAEAARLDPPGTLALPWLRMRAGLRLARGHEGAEPLAHRAVAFLGRQFLHRENRLSLLELRIQLARYAGDAAGALAAARIAVAEPTITDRPRYGWAVLAAAATAAMESADAELPARIRRVAGTMPQRYPADRAYATQVAATLTGRPELWREAVAAWRADGQRYPLAVALQGLAAAAAGAGDRPGAAEAVEEAAAVAGALGARPLAEAADTLARRIGLRSAAHPAATGTETLTDREREVLRLVAEGRSNSGIARQLYISPKTASVHVSRIIAKLKVASRGEAAAVAHRLGLLDD